MTGKEEMPDKPDATADPFSMQGVEIRDEESPFLPGRAKKVSPALEHRPASGPVPPEGGLAEPTRSGSFVPAIATEPEEDLSGISDSQTGKERFQLPALGWFVFAGLMLFVGAGAVKLLLSDIVAPDAQLEVIEEELEWSDEQLLGDEATRQLMRQMNEAARGYLGAQSIEQKLAHARHADRVRPLMERYYDRHEMVAQEFVEFEHYQAVQLGSVSFIHGSVKLRGGGSKQVLMEYVSDGSFKVDWESDVCYLPLPWDEFISKRPHKGLVMRVYAEPDSFYAFEFRDEGLYDCYRLYTPGSEDYVFGYAQKTSEAGRNMRRLFGEIASRKGVIKPEPLTLMLRFPENSRSSRAVHIDRLMAPRWVFVREQEAETGQ